MSRELLSAGCLACLLWLSSCQVNDTDTQTDVAETASASTDATATYQSRLQGTWKRESYPYGTIVFDGDRVKFVAGEGAAEAPRFTSFRLAANCPNTTAGTAPVEDFDVALLTDDKRCDLLRFADDRFTIYYEAASAGVVYTKLTGDDASERESATPPPGTELEDAANADEDDAIAAIRAEYQRIVAAIDAGRLQRQEQTFTCQTRDGHGRLVRYLDDGEVVMLEYVEGISHAFVTRRLYFKNGEPFFLFVEDGTWSPGGPLNEDGTAGSTDNIEEYRYYLQNGEIIRKLAKSFTRRSWTDDPTSAEVSNQKVKNEAGEHYPDAAVVARWKAGEVGC